MAETYLVRCPACGTTNRVPQSKLDRGLAPVCGKCRQRLPIEQKPITVTDANYTEVVERYPLPVLLDLWAPWCGPCRMIAPAVDEIASEMAGRVRVGKLNVDENPATAGRFRVEGIPTLLVLKGGREVDRIVGLQPKEQIKRRLERVAAPVSAGR
jgi:thioredoxin 2